MELKSLCRLWACSDDGRLQRILCQCQQGLWEDMYERSGVLVTVIWTEKDFVLKPKDCAVSEERTVSSKSPLVFPVHAKYVRLVSGFSILLKN